MSQGGYATAVPSTTIAAAGDTNGADLVGGDFPGALFALQTTGFSGDATITDLKVQAKLPDGTYATIVDFSALAIASNATFLFCVYPGSVGTFGLKSAPAGIPLPNRFRVVLTATRSSGSITAIVTAIMQP